jgi:hypothetical protein
MNLNITYSRLERLFETRRKDASYKPVLRDCRMYKDDDGSFLIKYLAAFYVQDPATRGYARKQQEYNLARVTPDDELVFLLDDEKLDQTTSNKLGTLLGHYDRVRADKKGYRNYAQYWRVHVYADGGTKQNNWPYFPGMRFRREGGNHLLVNPMPDVVTRVQNSAVQAAKSELGDLRKLIQVMTRMGAMDKYCEREVVSKLRSGKFDEMGLVAIERVNYADPNVIDAESVVAYGTTEATWGPSYVYQNGRYASVPEEERRKVFLKRAVQAGLDRLRSLYYAKTGGYVKHVQ